MSLRYALTGDPEFSTTEAVGVLMSLDGNGHITVMDRRGITHDVAIASIQALKVFPP